jgi:hypothetical protein
MSYGERVQELKKKEAQEKPEWNESVTTEKRQRNAEDRMASKIANEVLRDNANLRGVHSKTSI